MGGVRWPWRLATGGGWGGRHGSRSTAQHLVKDHVHPHVHGWNQRNAKRRRASPGGHGWASATGVVDYQAWDGVHASKEKDKEKPNLVRNLQACSSSSSSSSSRMDDALSRVDGEGWTDGSAATSTTSSSSSETRAYTTAVRAGVYTKNE